MSDRYDEELFLGYLEGDLSLEKTLEFEKLLVEDARLRNLVAQLVIDRHRVRNLPKESAPPDLMDRVNANLERSMLLGAPGSEVAPASPFRFVKAGRYAALAALVALVAVISGGMWRMLNDDDVNKLTEQQIARQKAQGPRVAMNEPNRPSDDAAELRKSGSGAMADNKQTIPALEGAEAGKLEATGQLGTAMAKPDAPLKYDGDKDTAALERAPERMTPLVGTTAPPTEDTPLTPRTNTEATIEQLALGKSADADEFRAGEGTRGARLRGGTGGGGVGAAGGAAAAESMGRQVEASGTPPAAATNGVQPGSGGSAAPRIEEGYSTRTDALKADMAKQAERPGTPTPPEIPRQPDASAPPPAATPAPAPAAVQPGARVTEKLREEIAPAVADREVPTPGTGFGLKLAASDLNLEVTAPSAGSAELDLLLWAADNDVRIITNSDFEGTVKTVDAGDGTGLREVKVVSDKSKSQMVLVVKGRQIASLLSHLNRPKALTTAKLNQQVPTASLVSARRMAKDRLESAAAAGEAPTTQPAGQTAGEAERDAGAEREKMAEVAEPEFSSVPVPLDEVAKSIPDDAEVRLPVIIRQRERETK
jgi:hypothetical protein